MLTLVVPIVLLALAPGEDARPLASRIEEVTVFDGSALVRRRAELPGGGGLFVIEGLPISLDPDSVRVRCTGGEVVGVETRDRHLPAVANARVQELRERVRALLRDRKVLEDQAAVLAQIEGHLGHLLKFDGETHNEDVKTGRGDLQSWGNNLRFLSEELEKNKSLQRENTWKREDLDAQLADLRNELGRGESGAGVDLREVRIEVAGGESGVLDLEYRVQRAGWRPVYDLRAASDAKSVELAYRAEVWQQSGEDWNDVELALSTARPNIGAQGPDPVAVWLRLFDPEAQRRSGPSSPGVATEGRVELKAMADAGDVKDKANAPSPFAGVEAQGLSVRFRLPRKETFQSRAAPTNVLVGRSKLDSTPEYFAAPALDTNVWLRGKTKNTSAWTLLPGRASVYFGADFIGHAQLAAVQPGEEFTLHLGADPAFTLERKQTEDLRKGPGVFGSKATQVEGWRIHLKNNGAVAVGADGVAQVFVRDVLPRATDDRIKVELSSSKPEPSDDERWKKDRDEQGTVTWALRIPKGGEADIVWQTKVSFPDGLVVMR
jgi:uncharacterized protein (TIGR02231 family)